MAVRESYVRYNPNDYEVMFLPIGEKVITELSGKRVRCVLTMEADEDFEIAAKVMASMRAILEIQKA